MGNETYEQVVSLQGQVNGVTAARKVELNPNYPNDNQNYGLNVLLFLQQKPVLIKDSHNIKTRLKILNEKLQHTTT